MRVSRRAVMGMLAAAGSGLLADGRLVRAAQVGSKTPDDFEHPAGAEIAAGPFAGTRESLGKYEVPEWFRDAKFGMWAHWGPQSAIGEGDWYARNMYIEGSEQYDYHVQRYGPQSRFGYKDTIPAWRGERFDPAALIKLYKAAGAKYFMSMGVHHDNFDLWDSRYQRWNAAKMGPHKDIVAMWRDAARAEGLRFGVSEHLWITYKWYSVSHGSDATGPLKGVKYDGAEAANRDLYVASDQIWGDPLEWNENGIPLWWRQQWFKRVKDLVDHCEPDFLYSDGALPFEYYGYNLVAHLYNQSARRGRESGGGGKTEAVYFSKRREDGESGICVLDRERGVIEEIDPRPWQSDTCIGQWHYKFGQKYKTPKQIVDQLVDIVSRNGNLMLNIPLPASGEPDAEELAIIAELTAWMKVNGEGIFGTRTWKVAGEGPPAIAKASELAAQFNESARHDLTAEDVRFTVKGATLYAFVMGWPEYEVKIKSLAQGTELRVGKIENVELLGFGGKLEWQQSGEGLVVRVPRGEAPTKYGVVFKVMGAV
ncbi:MAG TPA: alpha-L-fucosidase [Silvibacterium sp.]|nr:alpha-L-fucosidase [Silvibacterium sp.]